jgi:hypothetical protein
LEGIRAQRVMPRVIANAAKTMKTMR